MEKQFERFTIIPPAEITVVDVEAKLEDLYMEALRAIFRHDPLTPYADEPKQSRIAITSEYPEKAEAPFQRPQIVVSNITYQMNLDTTLNRNYYQEIATDGKYHDKRIDLMPIPYSLALIAVGGKSTSRNLANRIINYIACIYAEVFLNLNLNITNIAKGSTQASERYPEKVFDTVIQIQGHTEWMGTSSVVDPNKESELLRHIDIDTTA